MDGQVLGHATEVYMERQAGQGLIRAGGFLLCVDSGECHGPGTGERSTWPIRDESRKVLTGGEKLCISTLCFAWKIKKQSSMTEVSWKASTRLLLSGRCSRNRGPLMLVVVDRDWVASVTGVLHSQQFNTWFLRTLNTSGAVHTPATTGSSRDTRPIMLLPGYFFMSLYIHVPPGWLFLNI